MAFIKFEAAEADMQKIINSLSTMGSRVAHATRETLVSEAKKIIDESKKDAWSPIVSGRLRRSARVEDANNGDSLVIDVSMVYGGESAPYAWKVHEDPRTGRGAISDVAKSRGLKRTVSVKSAKHKSRFPYEGKSRVGQWKYLEQPYVLALPRVEEAVRKISDEEVSK